MSSITLPVFTTLVALVHVLPALLSLVTLPLFSSHSSMYRIYHVVYVLFHSLATFAVYCMVALYVAGVGLPCAMQHPILSSVLTLALGARCAFVVHVHLLVSVVRMAQSDPVQHVDAPNSDDVVVQAVPNIVVTACAEAPSTSKRVSEQLDDIPTDQELLSVWREPYPSPAIIKVQRLNHTPTLPPSTMDELDWPLEHRQMYTQPILFGAWIIMPLAFHVMIVSLVSHFELERAALVNDLYYDVVNSCMLTVFRTVDTTAWLLALYAIPILLMIIQLALTMHISAGHYSLPNYLSADLKAYNALMIVWIAFLCAAFTHKQGVDWNVFWLFCMYAWSTTVLVVWYPLVLCTFKWMYVWMSRRQYSISRWPAVWTTAFTQVLDDPIRYQELKQIGYRYLNPEAILLAHKLRHDRHDAQGIYDMFLSKTAPLSIKKQLGASTLDRIRKWKREPSVWMHQVLPMLERDVHMLVGATVWDEFVAEGGTQDVSYASNFA